MRIRNGFVSNSSSSSFIVLGKESNIEILPEGILQQGKGINCYKMYLKLPTKGQKHFGYQFKRYYKIQDKINFTFLQIQYITDDWLKKLNCKMMLASVIRKHMDQNFYFDFKIDYNYLFEDSLYDKACCYIDHASSAVEGKNMEIFESEETLENFIFNKNSYIQCGCDSEIPTPQYKAALKEKQQNENS